MSNLKLKIAEAKSILIEDTNKDDELKYGKMAKFIFKTTYNSLNKKDQAFVRLMQRERPGYADND